MAIMAAVGFEPTPPERLEPKSSALDRSATLPTRPAPQHLALHVASHLQQLPRREAAVQLQPLEPLLVESPELAQEPLHVARPGRRTPGSWCLSTGEARPITPVSPPLPPGFPWLWRLAHARTQVPDIALSKVPAAGLSTLTG